MIQVVNLLLQKRDGQSGEPLNNMTEVPVHR